VGGVGRDCTLAAFGDVFTVAFVYALLALKNRNWRWGLPPPGMDYALAALVSGGMAIIVGRLAIGQGRWSYTDAMPRLPTTDVGVASVPAAVSACAFDAGHFASVVETFSSV
jgi:hypothetical protein